MIRSEEASLRYYEQMNEQCPTLALYSRNMNLAYMHGQLDPCYYREAYIDRIQKILLRKNKANVLLYGVPGCGKTAIVEGLAALLTERKLAYELECDRERKSNQKNANRMRPDGAYADAPEEDFVAPGKPHLFDSVIYDLSLNALVSGTKYRGDFEARLQQIVNECKAHPDVILFVDEVHQLTSIGRGDGSESPAQALKPALARKDIRMIGATTTEERKLIAGDKALLRRFCEITVEPLSDDAAKQTAEKILADYCRFHGIVTDASAAELWEAVRSRLPDTVFPDNLINVIDETLAAAVFDGRYAVGMDQFRQVLNRIATVKIA